MSFDRELSEYESVIRAGHKIDLFEFPPTSPQSTYDCKYPKKLKESTKIQRFKNQKHHAPSGN